MCIYDCFAFVFALLHGLTDHANHPDYPGNMIEMLVRHKNSFYLFPIDSGMFQLVEDLASSTAIYQEILIAFVQDEAGVVALGGYCVAGA